MSNGQNNAGPSQDLVLQFSSLLGRDRMVNSDQLVSILDQVSRARMVLDNIEQEAHNRHAAYQGTVQQLEARVQQGVEAQRLLRRLGVQAQPSVPLINGPSVAQSPRADGYYPQQPQPQQVPYQAAAATASGYAQTAGPSTSYQTNSYAAQPRQYATYAQHQQASQPISQHYRNYGTQQQPPHPPPALPRQAAPSTQTYSHASIPMTSAMDSPFYQSTEHNGQHASAQYRPSAASPPIVRTQPVQPAQRHSQSPQVSTPPAPLPAFPPLDSHGTSNRPTVLVGSVQTSPIATSSSPPAIASQSSRPTATPVFQATSEQLTAITMKIHDLLKQPQTREVLESVLKLVMKEMHSRGQMTLSDRDIQQVYAWQLMPHIASEVTPLVQGIVQCLSPLHAGQATPLFKFVLQTVNRFHPVANANVQSLNPRPEAAPASPSVPHTNNGPTVNPQETPRPTMSPTPIPQPSLESHNLSTISRPDPAQNPTSHAPPVPDPPMVNGSSEPHIQTGPPFSATAINGHVSSNNSESSTIRPAQTVLRMVSSAQGSPPSTPSAGGPSIVLTPNTKTLARDILRSLGRPSGSFSPSSQGSPTPSRPQPESSAPPPRQDALPKVPVQATIASDLQYREKEVIVIDDDSSVSSRAAAPDDFSVNGEPLPTNPVGTSLSQPPSPPQAPSSPTLPYPPAQRPPLESPRPPKSDAVDHEVEEIQTPGVIQMAYEEVQEILQGQSTMDPPSNPLDNAVGTSATILPAPVSLSSPMISSVASPPPRSHSSMSVEPGAVDEPPVAGPSREPLFLASSPASSSVDVETQMVLERDESESNNAFSLTGLLGSTLNKGKGRALDSDSDDAGVFESPHRPVKRQKVEHVEDDDETEVEVIETSEPEEWVYLTPPRRGWEVYVDVPPLNLEDRHVIDLSTIPSKPERARPLVVLSPSPSSNSGVEIIEDDEIEESDGGRQERLDEEREAVNLSLSRLREMPCRWRGCSAVLNSGERLAQHLRLHASEKHQAPFICDWEGCSRRFAKAAQFTEHCSHHSEAQLFCAFANCMVVALTPLELGRHQQPRNHRTQLLKREVSIFRPQLGQLPPLPPTLPAYKSVPLRVSRARIPRDKHIWIGSKIAANITCYVHPGTRANHDVAAPSRTSRRLAEKVAEIERRAQEAGLDPTQAVLHMNHGEYDAWLPYSSQYGPKYCDDLPSSAVTSMVKRGLVIGAEYLEGDRRFPPPQEEEEGSEEEEDQLQENDNEGNDLEEGAHEVGNESDRTIVIDEFPQEIAVSNLKANALPDVIMADEQGPDNEADDEEVRIEVLQPSSGVLTPTSHGDQQNVDKVDDAYGTGSDAELMSQPEWNFLRKDSEDVNSML